MYADAVEESVEGHDAVAERTWCVDVKEGSASGCLKSEIYVAPH